MKKILFSVISVFILLAFTPTEVNASMEVSNKLLKKPTITIKDPNGGESWMYGEKQKIKWSSKNLKKGKLEIALYSSENGGLYCPIGKVSTKKKSYTFVPKNDYECKPGKFLDPGSYILQIKDENETSDKSDYSFLISLNNWWESKVDAILQSDLDEKEVAKKLLQIYQTLPSAGKEEVAQHIVNLLPDDQFYLIKPIILNSKEPSEVLDVFMTDIMNRDEVIKIPLLLEIAKIRNHPHAEEAITDLEIFLDDDFGKDWLKWNKAVTEYLKKLKEDEEAWYPPIPQFPRRK